MEKKGQPEPCQHWPTYPGSSLASKEGDKEMEQLRCSCGYAGDEAGFADHIGEVFTPIHHDVGTDGQAHAELAADRSHTAGEFSGVGRVPGLACLCGYSAGDAAELNDHLLATFITVDRVGADGEKHEPAWPVTTSTEG
jgi:hypothetical protein